MTRDKVGFWYDSNAEPALVVESGQKFVVETEDAHSGTITGPHVVYSDFEDV